MIYLYRCDDCGHIFAVENGGPVGECCARGDLRRFSYSTVTVPLANWEQIPNPARETVDGPPQFAWNQGTTRFGLYVKGECVAEVEAGALHIAPINKILRSAHLPS